jgi:gamma-glutamylcyclotransferase (GGCT)/AIG2-like uncharacterized protein YtfP
MTTPGNYQLFVYGSLRKGFRSPMYEYISRYFQFVGNGKVKGELYDLGEYPAGISTTADNFIIGELYKVNEEKEFSWAMAQLDDYEGVNAESHEAQLFRREMTEVYIGNDITQAWIYWYNGDVSGSPLITSGDLIQYLHEKK